ncbi:transcriptional regulator, XRE family with cupin sensor [Methanohalophilus portucalensis FDF-1]|uniref:Transcriptional regulator, XRE family with cupin sensor n=3 Tax=Methanohalophilus portucalensis TaxID=39664 RepID=A0A1X7NZR4_9EURY|nr:transcriptional regulator, XRE family with cupin sensor [Methanohalophilus portucalensis FDF-1]
MDKHDSLKGRIKMQEKIKEISSRVKELRGLSGISAEEIASSLDIALEEYNKYESGELDIPASILFEIAQLLGVDMTVLLTGEDPRMHIFTITRKDEGVSVERRKQYQYEGLAPNFIHKKAEPFVVTVKPQSNQDSTPNSHPGQEFDYVLEGSLKVIIHDNEIILNEGDSIYFDSNYNHSMQAVGDKSAKFLAIIF